MSSGHINGPKFKHGQTVYLKEDILAHPYNVINISYGKDEKWRYELELQYGRDHSWVDEEKVSDKPSPVEKRIENIRDYYLTLIPQKATDEHWLARRFELRVDEFEFLLQKAGYL
jgi:hypothetical protein